MRAAAVVVEVGAEVAVAVGTAWVGRVPAEAGAVIAELAFGLFAGLAAGQAVGLIAG